MDPTAPRPQIVLARTPAFRVGVAEVRPETREVIGPNGTEILEPRVMQVLVALAQAEGGVVARDDLIARCWDGRAVGEDAITRVIARLRKLSDDLGPGGFTVETITKVGYRLLPAGAPRTATPAKLEPATPSRRRLLYVGGGVAAAAVAGAAGWTWLRPRRREPTLQARELYERGREAIGKGMPIDNAQAVAFLREAVAESPDYAEAWGALALAYAAGLGFAEPARQAGVAAQAEAAARRGLQLNPQEPDSAVALALLTPIYRNWATAERRIDLALRLHPREPRLEIVRSLLLAGVGRMQDAVGPAEIAVAGDKFAPWYPFGLACCLWSVGRIEEAERVLRDALKLWPRQHALWFRLFYLLSHTGRGDQAIAMAQDQATRPPGVLDENIDLHIPAARALMTRAPADVDKAARLQLAAAARGMGYAENAIDWLSALGRVDDAYRVARAMYFGEGFAISEQRFAGPDARFMSEKSRNTTLLFMPPTAPMRADPRFGRLVADIGLADYWRRAGVKPDPAIWRGA